MLIKKRSGEAVDLRFRRQLERRVGLELQETLYAPGKLVHGVRVEGIVERKHRLEMANLGEGGDRCGADLKRRRIRSHQLGEPGLDRRVASAQRVVLRIG